MAGKEDEVFEGVAAVSSLSSPKPPVFVYTLPNQLSDKDSSGVPESDSAVISSSHQLTQVLGNSVYVVANQPSPGNIITAANLSTPANKTPDSKPNILKRPTQFIIPNQPPNQDSYGNQSKDVKSLAPQGPMHLVLPNQPSFKNTLGLPTISAVQSSAAAARQVPAGEPLISLPPGNYLMFNQPPKEGTSAAPLSSSSSSGVILFPVGNPPVNLGQQISINRKTEHVMRRFPSLMPRIFQTDASAQLESSKSAFGSEPIPVSLSPADSHEDPNDTESVDFISAEKTEGAAVHSKSGAGTHDLTFVQGTAGIKCVQLMDGKICAIVPPSVQPSKNKQMGKVPDQMPKHSDKRSDSMQVIPASKLLNKAGTEPSNVIDIIPVVSYGNCQSSSKSNAGSAYKQIQGHSTMHFKAQSRSPPTVNNAQDLFNNSTGNNEAGIKISSVFSLIKSGDDHPENEFDANVPLQVQRTRKFEPQGPLSKTSKNTFGISKLNKTRPSKSLIEARTVNVTKSADKLGTTKWHRAAENTKLCEKAGNSREACGNPANLTISFTSIKELERNRLKEIIKDKIEKRYAQQLQSYREKKFNAFLKSNNILGEMNRLSMENANKGSIVPTFNYRLTRSAPPKLLDPEYEKLDSVYSSILASILKNTKQRGNAYVSYNQTNNSKLPMTPQRNVNVNFPNLNSEVVDDPTPMPLVNLEKSLSSKPQTDGTSANLDSRSLTGRPVANLQNVSSLVGVARSKQLQESKKSVSGQQKPAESPGAGVSPSADSTTSNQDGVNLSCRKRKIPDDQTKPKCPENNSGQFDLTSQGASSETRTKVKKCEVVIKPITQLVIKKEIL